MSKKYNFLKISRIPRYARNFCFRVGVFDEKPWDGTAIVLHDYAVVCYLVPKVACSTLTSVCVDMLGFSLPESSWKPGVFRSNKYDEYIDKEKRDIAKIDKDVADNLTHYWRFGFVRNPYDRLVSCYEEKIRSDGPPGLFVDGVSRALLKYEKFFKGMSFYDFASVVASIPDEQSDRHFKSQYMFLSDSVGNLTVDYIGRLETIDNDIREVVGRLDKEVVVPHLLKSKRSDTRDYYDEKTRRLVYERYRRDFELFGYDEFVLL